MKTLLLLALLFYFGYDTVGQTIIGRQLADQYPISNNSKTYGLTWLPVDYNSTNTDYPLIIFLHAAGETGDNISDLKNLLRVGLPRKIAEGWDPQAVNPVDGENYQFIVVSPQAPTKSGWSYSYSQVKNILPDVIKRYRIDKKRIYLMGISAGGGGTWSSVTNDDNFTKEFAAILPVSSVGVNNPAVEAPNIKYIGGKNDVKVWTVCGAKDVFYNIAASYVNTINTANPAPAVPALVTGVPGYGHDTALWTMTFDPSWRNNSIHLNFYEWMLQYQRNDVIKPPPNQPPVVDAGADKGFALPKDTTRLRGSASDPDGTIISYRWRKISGHSNCDIDESAMAETMIRNLEEGVYEFELKATDNKHASTEDTVTITVLPYGNQPPVADAGSDQSVTLPLDSVQLSGSAKDADGTISSYLWRKVSGPSQFSIGSPNQAKTTISNLAHGKYSFEFKVTDDSGNEANDTVVVTVLAASNQPPVAKAGKDQTITLPEDSVFLSGSATDADGTIESYSWSKISGPSKFTIDNSNAAAPVLSNLVPGTYTFRLTVTDNDDATATDDINIVVNPMRDDYQPIPGKIEAESYVTMSGIATEITGDQGGGRDVGWINNGDWMNFDVNVESPGIYTVSFRIATPNIGAKFQLQQPDGTVLANVDIPRTGSYQGWLTHSVAVSLSGGYQTLKVISTGNPGWNINWIEFASGEPSGKIIPSKIEAEDYDAMEGIQLEVTGDKDGGLNVGWISDEDWLDYDVNASSEGKYIVTFRIASPNRDAKLQILQSDGTVLAKVDIPYTGGYQVWSTVSTTVSLPKGQQTLRIISKSFADWNINWIDFVKESELIAQNMENLSQHTDASNNTSSSEISPNPAKDRFTLLINSTNTGVVKIQIADFQGTIRKEFRQVKDLKSPQSVNLSLYGLPPGMYTVRLQLGNWIDLKFIMKE